MINLAFIKVMGLSGDAKVVPRSSYENYLKSIGYTEIKDNPKEKWSEEDSGEISSHEGEDLESIPISEMSGKQLKDYAKLKGIDLTGVKSTSEAREVVREWIQEEGE